MVRVLDETPPLKYARSQLGYMPQSEALYNDLTANENLRFFGSLYGMKRRALDEALLHVLEFVRLDKTGRKVVASFSGGMKRRLSLAIALLHSPRLLVLDEPTVGLDPEHRVSLWQGFHALAASGTGLLVTTHVMDEAANCDEIAMLRDGSIIARGTPDELIARAKAQTLEEAFLVFGASGDQPGFTAQVRSDSAASDASPKEGATHA
jgi:ABC-2 type transport system ATP-binding protein